MKGPGHHICVCICTFRRPELLASLLVQLETQITEDAFTYSVVIVDNDSRESAREVVTRFAQSSRVPIKYCVESMQNIAMARNAAVVNATGDYVAFMDDDEQPASDWLVTLYKTAQDSGADGVLGPVLPRFLTPPPDWIVRGEFFNRESPPSGTWLRWDQTRSGNVLLRRRIFEDRQNLFTPDYGAGGEDVDFFRRMIRQGMRFIWCEEAAVHEIVPPERWRRSYLVRRSLLRGKVPYNQEGLPLMRSFLAVPSYALLSLLCIPFGQHVFMRYLLKECDHLGRILAFLRLGFLLPQRYVSQ